MLDNTFDLLKFQFINQILNSQNMNINYSLILIILSIIYNYRENIYIYLNNYYNFNYYNHVYIIGKRSSNGFKTTCSFSDNFRAIWEYVNNNINLFNISSIKEYYSEDYYWNNNGEKIEKNSNIFIVNQINKFELSKDIYCIVTIDENNQFLNDDKDRIKDEIITLDIFSNYSVNEIKKFLSLHVKQKSNYDENIRIKVNNDKFSKKTILKKNEIKAENIDNKYWGNLEKQIFCRLYLNEENKLEKYWEYCIFNMKILIRFGQKGQKPILEQYSFEDIDTLISFLEKEVDKKKDKGYIIA